MYSTMSSISEAAGGAVRSDLSRGIFSQHVPQSNKAWYIFQCHLLAVVLTVARLHCIQLVNDL